MRFILQNKLMLFALIVFSAPGSLTAQDKSVDEKLKKHAGHNAVFLNNACVYTIDIVKGNLSVTRDIEQEILYISDNTHLLNEGKVYHSYFFELAEVKAETQVPTGNGSYKTMKVTEFTDRADSESAIFYDDSKVRTFVYPGLCKGAKTLLKYRVNLKDPFLIPSFHFAYPVPVEQASLKILVHKDVSIRYSLQNIDSTKIIHTTKSKGKFIEHEFAMKDVKEYDKASNSVPVLYFSPHIFLYISKYKNKDIETPVLATNDDMYRWYFDHIRKNINENSDELKKVTDSISAVHPGKTERAAAVFNWVQENVKYIAIEDGLRGYVPNKPSLVCHNRYGDCKDMANLLAEMLNLAGLKAYRTWIGTRDLPYKFSELPLPAVSNHMITALEQGDSLIFLDATGSHTQFGYPSDMIQGKEALISIDSTKYLIRNVPVIPAHKSVLSDSVTISMDGSELKGTGYYALTGYLREDVVHRLTGKNKENEEKHVNGIVQKGNNKFSVQKYEINALKDKSKPLSISYSFNIRDYINNSGNEVFINLHLDKFLNNNYIDTNEYKNATESSYKYTIHTVTTFEIPKGYKLSHVPQDVSFDYSDYRFKFRYEVKGDKVTLITDGVLDHLYLSPDKFREWNKFIKKLTSSYKECISIVKA